MVRASDNLTLPVIWPPATAFLSSSTLLRVTGDLRSYVGASVLSKVKLFLTVRLSTPAAAEPPKVNWLATTASLSAPFKAPAILALLISKVAFLAVLEVTIVPAAAVPLLANFSVVKSTSSSSTIALKYHLLLQQSLT